MFPQRVSTNLKTIMNTSGKKSILHPSFSLPGRLRDVVHTQYEPLRELAAGQPKKQDLLFSDRCVFGPFISFGPVRKRCFISSVTCYTKPTNDQKVWEYGIHLYSSRNTQCLVLPKVTVWQNPYKTKQKRRNLMGPEAAPRQVLCEEFGETLVKPCKNEGGRYAIRNPSDVK